MSSGAKMKLRIRNDEHCKKPVQLAVSMTGISLGRLLCATFSTPTCTPVQISERHRWVPRKIVRLDHRDKSKDLGVNERRRKNATRRGRVLRRAGETGDATTCKSRSNAREGSFLNTPRFGRPATLAFPFKSASSHLHHQWHTLLHVSHHLSRRTFASLSACSSLNLHAAAYDNPISVLPPAPHYRAPTMSAPSTPNDSPSHAPIQPLHNPSQAAHVVVPQAPLGNTTNAAPGMGAKALLAKKMAKSL